MIGAVLLRVKENNVRQEEKLGKKPGEQLEEKTSEVIFPSQTSGG